MPGAILHAGADLVWRGPSYAMSPASSGHCSVSRPRQSRTPTARYRARKARCRHQLTALCGAIASRCWPHIYPLRVLGSIIGDHHRPPTREDAEAVSERPFRQHQHHLAAPISISSLAEARRRLAATPGGPRTSAMLRARRRGQAPVAARHQSAVITTL